jgi:hypothetical protein
MAQSGAAIATAEGRLIELGQATEQADAAA